MADFDQINEARKLLGIGESATLKEIKNAYRKMAFRHHPDKHAQGHSVENDEMMKKVNWAYKILLLYCNDFKYTFRQEDVARTYFDEEYARKWKENWFDSI